MQQTIPQPNTRAAPTNRGWTKRLFNAKAAQTGGVIRRNKRDVHREMGYAALVTEVAGTRLSPVGMRRSIPDHLP